MTYLLKCIHSTSKRKSAIGKHGLWLNFVLMIISGQSVLQIGFLHFNKHSRTPKMQKTHSKSMRLLGKIVMRYVRACISSLYNMVIIYWQSVKMLLYHISNPGAGTSARQECCLWGEARAAWIKPAPAHPPQDTAEALGHLVGPLGEHIQGGATHPQPHTQDAGWRKEEETKCLVSVLHPNCKAYHFRTEKWNAVGFGLFLTCTAVPFQKAALLNECYYWGKLKEHCHYRAFYCSGSKLCLVKHIFQKILLPSSNMEIENNHLQHNPFILPNNQSFAI